MNINRDYLIINDVKKSNIKLDNGSIFFYITDKNTQNIFVNLVINVSNNDLIQKYANIENAEDYTLTMNIVKPSNTYKVIEGKLHDKEKAIFEFNLPEDCCDEIGPYRCELLTKCNINGHEEITTSNKLTYKVKSSILNDLDEIQEAPKYPLVIQLFDKLSDINQYEEDRRANELARQLAEQQRQTRFDALDSDMTDSIQAMDDKVIDVENRVSIKEQAVDKLIVDTKADIDEYKVAKDQEINNAITAQDNKIDTAITSQNDRITVVENNVVAQNTRLDAIEVKNQQQDDRLLDIEKVNKRQDMNLKCLFAESKNNMIDVTEEGNSIYLQNSTVGYTLIDEIQGQTLVNCNKEPYKEIILNGNINTKGYSNVTLTEGVDGGLVDVALEGNTMVNVCDQKDPVAITKSYTVETGNHVALQGEYDGKCRPVVTGNTLWIDNGTGEVLTAFDESKNLRLQSSFEDKVVTQEMVDAGEEEESNLGKYRVDYKVTGKNKFDKDNVTISLNSYLNSNNGNILNGNPSRAATDFIKIRPNTICQISGCTTTNIIQYDKDKKYISNYSTGNVLSDKACYIRFTININNDYTNIQLEEGSTATSYEPYKEYKKTFYLNSPLLEGDTIEQQGNNVVHVHRSEIRAYETDDELTLPTDMTNTLVAKATPQYEVISQNDTILCDSYVNGHLDVDSVVPIKKVDFLPFTDELTYLYPSTQYTLQFVSDAVSKVDITLGGAELLNQDVVLGINKYTITTPSELIDNNLVLNGEGFNASNIVVTEATDQDFGYFEGMKSVGECEDLEVMSSNSDNTLSNTQTLTHEPLRAVGDTKDKYVLIDGKWYIERNCAEVLLDGVTNSGFTKVKNGDNSKGYIKYPLTREDIKENSNIVCDTLKKASDVIGGAQPFSCIITKTGSYKLMINLPVALVGTTDTSINNYLKNNNIRVVMELISPVYEEINYNPLEVYSDITHITTNSAIPTNITIKNHGFNCLLKPSTTYTVSSNLGLSTVTTGADIGDSCLRFYDTDTSDITTMKNVLLLEGDWTTKSDLVPSNFSGIESAFEQEYDAEKGKYRVNVKVIDEDKTRENNIQLYINKPLRGTGDTKDRVFIQDDKVIVQRNCGIRAYEDGDFGTHPTDKVNTVYPLAEPAYEEVEYNDTKLFIESFKNSTLFYNSNVAVSSKLYYSYSVPIVDTVAQTANVTDQQDSMIIDLATQCAVMEMMLM